MQKSMILQIRQGVGGNIHNAHEELNKRLDEGFKVIHMVKLFESEDSALQAAVLIVLEING